MADGITKRFAALSKETPITLGLAVVVVAGLFGGGAWLHGRFGDLEKTMQSNSKVTNKALQSITTGLAVMDERHKSTVALHGQRMTALEARVKALESRRNR